MQDPSVMPEKIKALLDSEGATDIVVSEYAPMTGGYSRLMARFEHRLLMMALLRRGYLYSEETLLKGKP